MAGMQPCSKLQLMLLDLGTNAWLGLQTLKCLLATSSWHFHPAPIATKAAGFHVPPVSSLIFREHLCCINQFTHELIQGLGHGARAARCPFPTDFGVSGATFDVQATQLALHSMALKLPIMLPWNMRLLSQLAQSFNPASTGFTW